MPVRSLGHAVLKVRNRERAEQFYNSPEYQSIKKLRDGAANVQFILIEGS